MSDRSTARFLRLTEEVRASLGEPLLEETGEDGTIRFVGGEPGEVVVDLSRKEIRVSEFVIHWEVHTPVLHPRWVATVAADRLRRKQVMKVLSAAVEVVRAARRSKYRTCTRCGKRTPPEWMHSDDAVCQGCAERYLGVVY